MEIASRVETSRLADQLERSFRGGAWHGPALFEVLEGLDAETAACRCLPRTHTIGEIVGHLGYWLEVGRKRLAGERPESDEDWPDVEIRTEEQWRRALDSLERSHRALQAAVHELDDARLDASVEGSDPTARGLLLGLLQHNAYHAGQLLMLARAAEASRP